MGDSTSPRLIVPGMAGIYEGLSDWGYALLRFVGAFTLIPHGCQKLFGWFGGGGIDGTAKFFASVHIEPAVPMVTAAGLVEVFCGIALALGFLTRIAAGGIVILAIVAIFVFNLERGFFVNKGGVEHMLIILSIGIFFWIRGGGKISIDSMIGREF